mmetsp:Transcript_4777/g.9690  ORF Transcript_4777/g.9690 Transcript_4777/m.9690 type:complete len:326 (-) Transcript_4777:152-1129(-)
MACIVQEKAGPSNAPAQEITLERGDATCTSAAPIRAKQFILCFETPTDERLEPTCRQRCFNLMRELFCLASPCSSRSKTNHMLRFHLAYCVLQLIASITLVALGHAPLRLLLFGVVLFLQANLTYTAIREVERHRHVRDFRHNQVEVKAKLCTVASLGFLAPLWWLFEATGTCAGPFVCFEDESPASESSGKAFALLMMAHYMLVFAHLVCVARTSSRRLVLSMLRPRKIEATRYGSTPWALGDDAACSICLSEYEAHEQVIVLPCGHVYHADCISVWLRRAEMCPLRCDAAVFELPPVGGHDFGRWGSSDGDGGTQRRGPEETV